MHTFIKQCENSKNNIKRINNTGSDRATTPTPLFTRSVLCLVQLVRRETSGETVVYFVFSNLEFTKKKENVMTKMWFKKSNVAYFISFSLIITMWCLTFCECLINNNNGSKHLLVFNYFSGWSREQSS